MSAASQQPQQPGQSMAANLHHHYSMDSDELDFDEDQDYYSQFDQLDGQDSESQDGDSNRRN